MQVKTSLWMGLAWAASLWCALSHAQPEHVTPTVITADFSQSAGPMQPVWAWFGHDEPNYTYMKDGRQLLTDLAAISPVPVHLRTHNLLTSGNGMPSLKWGSTNMYTEDAHGNPVYSWTIADRIFDTYVQRGIKPLAQIGFMPKALSTHPEPYENHWKAGLPNSQFATGWAYPPKDYKKWGELVYQWVKHCVKRYGRQEVASWYWEVWNEPDGLYWKGTRPEFFKLYDYAADAVKRALPEARVGGPDVTGGGMSFLNDFLQHCLRDTNYVTGKIGSPLDLVLFHAKGSPKVVNGIVVMNAGAQLRNVIHNFKVIDSFPELKNIPIVIGESDPEGCAACGMATNPENAYRNGTMYSSYTAASLARIYELATLYHKNLIGALNWSFEFENQPWFAGYRDLATNGVHKPVFNVFKMLGKMQGNRVPVTSNRQYELQTAADSSLRGQQTDIGAMAAKSAHKATVLLWDYHDADQLEPDELVKLELKGLPANPIKVTRYCIDQHHSNAYTVWKSMGSPQHPNAKQISRLKASARLQTAEPMQTLKAKQGKLSLTYPVSRQGVYLVELLW